MNTKVENAVKRWNKILPLAKRQQGLNRERTDVYQNILYSYVQRGTSMNRNEIARQVSNIDEAISIRQTKRAILNSDKNREIFDLDDDVGCATEFFVPLMTYEAA
jgi:hypothetical protein